ncbi:MAG: aminoglycoside phosphotransferase family protein [Roseiflexaceae bacterium]
MELPPFPDISDDLLHAIAERHGVAGAAITRLPEVGIFNAIYALGSDLILRIPRDHPAFTDAARKEVLAVPAARAAGVRTPDLLAFDVSLELLPVPYTMYERVHGETLGLLDHEPGDSLAAWHELGRDLALLHTHVAAQGPIAEIEIEGLPDPRLWLDQIAQEGYFTSMEARWLRGWLDRLAPAALAVTPRRFLHGDIQTTNMLVRAGSLDYLAIIDWGSAGWCDPAWDFAGVPLRAVPLLLQGYREVATLDHEPTAEARILWRHLQLALLVLRRGPMPERSWAERPLAMLLEIMRFMIESPAGVWRDVLG